MAKVKRLSKVARECNVGIQTIVEFLNKKGFDVENNPNFKVPEDALALIMDAFQNDLTAKREAEKFSQEHRQESKSDSEVEEETPAKAVEEAEAEEVLLISDASDTEAPAAKVTAQKEEPTESPAQVEEVVEESKPEIVGKIDLDPKPTKTEKIEKPQEIVPEELAKEEKTSEPVESKDQDAVIEKPKVEETKVEEPVVSKPDVEIVKAEEPKKEEPKVEEVKIEVQDNKISEQKAPEKAVVKEAPVEKEKTTPLTVVVESSKPESTKTDSEGGLEIKVVGKIDIDSINQKTRPDKRKKAPKERPGGKAKKQEAPIEPVNPTPEKIVAEKPIVQEEKKFKDIPDEAKGSAENREVDIKTKFEKLTGPTVVGKIVLPVEKKRTPAASSSDHPGKKKKRKRIRKDRVNPKDPAVQQKKPDSQKPPFKKAVPNKRRPIKPEVSEEAVQKQIKDTLARLTSKGKSKASKHRRSKRDSVRKNASEEAILKEYEDMSIQVTEFVTANELASLLDVPVNTIIAKCMNLGLFVSINQRLDAETITLVSAEFNHEVEFISIDVLDSIATEQEVDDEKNLKPRPPIITVMGHVDHGKTSLLDYVRSANVIAGEAGGITQHIGAYNVELKNGKSITFLDTPGHEAFTAMRARGAQVTDIAIIVVAADDAVMPQTIEAINHAAAAGVPMIFAINKIDKDGANPDRIKQELATMNYLIEEWGGKYQSHDISAKHGKGIEELLEKVLLEAELLELKANPDRAATGSVIEASLDKGRGYLTTLLVQSGTLKIGDIMLAGTQHGRVKAMFNERGKPITIAGPAEPAVILGLNGAPQAGDKFNIMSSEREAREISTKREQLQREQEIRTQKHITLDEIGRRIAIGNFQELNIIVKGDVDGSIEALADSLIKLSTEEIQINVKHKAVGQISENDVLLAAASEAIIIGFQVRPSLSARKIAEKEGVDIRLYSIIYDAINELRDAMEGMLSPEIKEEINGTLEILETFKITKVGTVAGCMVNHGKIYRDSKVRIIREGIVVYDGALGSLKRFKDEVKEVVTGLECGLHIERFNDLKAGDVIEAYTTREIKKKL